MDILKGGEFVYKNSLPSSIFLRENCSDEQDMIYNMAIDFVENEIFPLSSQIESKKEGISEMLFKKMGELGLLGAAFPEEYGGMDLDNNAVTLLLIGIGYMGSFNTSYAAHTGIGMLPIYYFGTEGQKKKYLPAMSAGDMIGSYCLTEPSSGSDALAAKTTARLNDQGDHYILNGQKMWITNAGFADIYIVFAQVDGDKFSAFIVEKGTPGLSLGEEEHKLGIHGSSTRQVFLDNVSVPVSALLGEIGKGHIIAFNILNVGRFKLGALCVAGGRHATHLSVQYANERIQFGKPISSFGAIRHKLAEQVIQTAATEAATFRLSNAMDIRINQLVGEGQSKSSAKLLAAKDYAIECSILKVAGSEMIDWVIDEGLQIHGGMGYSEESAISRMYRDARINRIYEGTNEINRLLIFSQLMKKGMKGEIGLMPVLMDLDGFTFTEGGTSAQYNMRKVILSLLARSGKLQMEKRLDLENAQEFMMSVADMCIALYVSESLWMRVEQRKNVGLEDQELWQGIHEVYESEALEKIRLSLSEALPVIYEGEALEGKWKELSALLETEMPNKVAIRQKVATRLIEANKFCF